jgi:hypothetical protein
MSKNGIKISLDSPFKKHLHFQGLHRVLHLSGVWGPGGGLLLLPGMENNHSVTVLFSNSVVEVGFDSLHVSMTERATRFDLE